MRPDDLHDLAGTLREQALASPARRAGQMLTPAGAGEFRQTVLVLLTGEALDEHEAPSTATLQVLEGRARLRVADAGIELDAGALVAIPQARHAVDALEDTAMLLTVAR